jgi:hypothetical protein
LVAIVGASSVTASSVTPETFAGNYQCAAGDTKIDPVAGGTYNLAGGGTITITIVETANGPTFDFVTSGATVSSVVVKGGPAYNLYTYAPPVTSDTGLHSPLNPNNDKWYGLSHLCIGSAKKDDPEPPKK